MPTGTLLRIAIFLLESPRGPVGLLPADTEDDCVRSTPDRRPSTSALVTPSLDEDLSACTANRSLGALQSKGPRSNGSRMLRSSSSSRREPLALRSSDRSQGSPFLDILGFRPAGGQPFVKYKQSTYTGTALRLSLVKVQIEPPISPQNPHQHPNQGLTPPSIHLNIQIDPPRPLP